MDAVINNLRKDFNVTIPAVKKRLRDLGFLDGIGVLEWDRDKNRYIDAYTYKKDSLSKDETYSITLSDFQRAFFDSKNLKLFGTILNDNFIYVDGHVIFNDEEYVFFDDFGDPVLTEYAKRHMDECALKFKVLNRSVHLSKRSIGTFCYLCKGIADDMSFDLILEANPTIINEGNLKEKRNKHEQVQKEVIRIIQDSPNLKECMNILVERYEYLPKEFASHGIQAGTYSRYVNGQVEKLDIRKAICLCHAFKFTPLVANEFIRKFSKEGLGTDDEGNALFMVVTSLRTWNIKKINQYLIEQGFKPLSS